MEIQEICQDRRRGRPPAGSLTPQYSRARPAAIHDDGILLASRPRQGMLWRKFYGMNSSVPTGLRALELGNEP